MRTFIKKDVVERVATKSAERPDTVAKIVNEVFTTLREIMAEADEEIRIEVRDFGVFEVKRTKPKPKARNPKTNEVIYVAARRKTHFKPGKLLKEALKKPLGEEP
jgi:integration host factor subunit beta